MKSIRSQGLGFVVSGFACLALESAAFAKTGTLVQLKRISVKDSSKIELAFEQKIDPSQVKTEFFNDIIQLTLKDVGVYPAKMNALNGKELTKVFAYQYAPDVTRCRFTVNGKAEDYKNRVRVHAEGKNLVLEWGAEDSSRSDTIQVTAAAAQREVPKAAVPLAALVKKDEETLRKIVAEDTKKDAAPAVEKAEKVEKTEKKADKSEKKPLTSAKPLPSPFRAFGILGAMVGALGILALIIRKARGGAAQPGRHSKLPAFAAGIVKKLGAGRSSGRAQVEVLATHHLGPKKSLSVVKIAGRTLVLGVTDEAINLITQLDSETSPEEALLEAMSHGNMGAAKPVAQTSYQKTIAADYQNGTGAVAAGPALFSDVFQMEAERPQSNKPVSQSRFSSVRDRIRNRLDGMKEI